MKIKSILLAGLLGLSSCASYSREDKIWATACFTSQATDYMTTQYALNREGFREANPAMVNNQGLLKLGLCGLIYGAGEMFPEDRKFFYKVGTIFGVGATGWNLYQLNKE